MPGHGVGEEELTVAKQKWQATFASRQRALEEQGGVGKGREVAAECVQHFAYARAARRCRAHAKAAARTSSAQACGLLPDARLIGDPQDYQADL